MCDVPYYDIRKKAEPDERKCHFGATWSISIFFGDLVQGCAKSETLFTTDAPTQIGFVKIFMLSWILDWGSLYASGGVLRRGTSAYVMKCKENNNKKKTENTTNNLLLSYFLIAIPLLSRIISKYDLVSHGPLMLILAISTAIT